MLKIGTVKWQGKCSRHPSFDPAKDGPGAIKGGCSRCQDLQTIYDTHQQVMRLMRTFTAPVERRKTINPGSSRQQSLFA